MRDVVFVLVLVGFFALAALCVRACAVAVEPSSSLAEDRDE